MGMATRTQATMETGMGMEEIPEIVLSTLETVIDFFANLRGD